MDVNAGVIPQSCAFMISNLLVYLCVYVFAANNESIPKDVSKCTDSNVPSKVRLTLH